MQEIQIDSLIVETAKLPMVKIDRESFLRNELMRRYSPEIVDKAIEYNPAYAGIKLEEIEKIAEGCIDAETKQVTFLSAAAAFPGGPVILATIPADLMQYFAHILRILQKLVYLYGWQDLKLDSEGMDDETKNRLILFVGIMFGVNGAAGVVKNLAGQVAKQVVKKLPQQALTKGIIYPTVKKIATLLGAKMTKDIFAKGISKFIPVISSLLNGALTYFTFNPMAHDLRRHLASYEIANPKYYKNNS